MIVVSTFLAGAFLAGYFVHQRATDSSTSLTKQEATPGAPNAELQARVEGFPIQGVIRVQGKLAVVSAGRVIPVGQPIDSDSGIIVSSVEHDAVVGGPPSRVVVWFEHKSGQRVSRKLASQVLLR